MELAIDRLGIYNITFQYFIKSVTGTSTLCNDRVVLWRVGIEIQLSIFCKTKQIKTPCIFQRCGSQPFLYSFQFDNLNNLRYITKNNVILPNFLVWKLGEITVFFAAVILNLIQGFKKTSRAVNSNCAIGISIVLLNMLFPNYVTMCTLLYVSRKHI